MWFSHEVADGELRARLAIANLMYLRLRNVTLRAMCGKIKSQTESAMARRVVRPHLSAGRCLRETTHSVPASGALYGVSCIVANHLPIESAFGKASLPEFAELFKLGIPTTDIQLKLKFVRVIEGS